MQPLSLEERHLLYQKKFKIRFSPVGWRKDAQYQVLDKWYRLKQWRFWPHGKRLIIVMTDETEFHGLADRIRTILAGYALACENGLNFFIHHTAGFKLETYLEPNEVNWLIPEHKISRGLNCVKTLWFLNQWPLKLRKRHEYHGYRLYTLWPKLAPFFRHLGS